MILGHTLSEKLVIYTYFTWMEGHLVTVELLDMLPIVRQLNRRSCKINTFPTQLTLKRLQ